MFMRRNVRIFSTVVFLLPMMLYSSELFSQINYANNYQISRTFINVKKPTGGVFDPTDTIEVRYTILVPQSPQPVGGSGAAQIRNILKSAQIIDTLPTNVNFVPGSLRITTNEGILYKGPFTDAADIDQGNYGVFGVNRIVNVRARPFSGVGTDTLSGGTWRWNGSAWQYNNNATPPRFSNNSFGMITYRVAINAAYGQFITFDKCGLWFRGTADASPVPKFRFPRSVIAIFQSPGTCNSGLALSNVFETNGSFGTGKPRNRGTASPIVPGGAIGYNFVTADGGNPNDGSYAIVNNSSDAGSSNTSFNGTFASPKIFDIFDIIGDHTGATNPAIGNLPVDTAAARPGGGYMLLVNASYLTNAAVTQTINNVCKNTYYEFSAWFRNVCARCGADSLGNGSTTWGVGWPANPAYLSWAGNDSAGVRPNLAFEINDTTYYTSGDLPYDKTQANAWKKRGFLFLNTLDSFRITIRNNSPGGGGNDWVMDDVGVSACVPSLGMNYTPFVLGCSDAPKVDVNLICTVRYAYNGSYLYYRWQRSTDNGATWTNIFTGGPAVPTLVAGQWQYTTNYQFLANGSDSGHRFRVIVATSLANLNSSICVFNDNTYTYLRFIKCSSILMTNLLSFTGKLTGNNAVLNWRTTSETNFSHYELEKSFNGINFTKIGELAGRGDPVEMNYSFTDPDVLYGSAYYRLKMVNNDGAYQYSKMVLLSISDYIFDVKPGANPFTGNLPVEYILPQDGLVHIALFDAVGKLVYKENILAKKGLNSTVLPLPLSLTAGLYTLKLQYQNESISKRIIKKSTM
jgi:trimeric autotransporter adhesin